MGAWRTNRSRLRTMRPARPASNRARSMSPRSPVSSCWSSTSSSDPMTDCSGLLISCATPVTNSPNADSRSPRTSCSRIRSSSVVSRITATKWDTWPAASTIGAATHAAWNTLPSLRASDAFAARDLPRRQALVEERNHGDRVRGDERLGRQRLELVARIAGRAAERVVGVFDPARPRDDDDQFSRLFAGRRQQAQPLVGLLGHALLDAAGGPAPGQSRPRARTPSRCRAGRSTASPSGIKYRSP